MKYLILLLLLAGLFFVLGLRRPRRPDRPDVPPADKPAPPRAMLSCAECGLHLPADETLPGKGGAFCSAAHRASFEARQGPG